MVPTGTGKRKKIKEKKKLHWKIEKNAGKVREICQPVIEKTLQYFLKSIFKKYWKTVKNTGKVREICHSEKVGTM